MGLQIAPRSEVGLAPGGLLAARGALSAALDQQLGSENGGVRSGVRLIASFRSPAGRYCRLFEAHAAAGATGLACKDAGGWMIVAMASAPPQGAGPLRQAASGLPQEVVAAMAQADLSEPLTADEERAAKAKAWREGR